MLIAYASAGSAASPSEQIYLGYFSQGDLDGWDEKAFSGETRYTIEQNEDGSVLAARSQSSASGLVKQQRVDLEEYPFLNWRWKVGNRLPARDESARDGDDYPVRLYVVFDGGLFFWQTRSINYVWSRNAGKGSTWPNAFAKRNVVMVSLRDGQDATGVWHEEKRNVLADVRRHFGSNIGHVVAVAIMTDTDNTGSAAESFYGDIYFSRQ